MNSWRQRLWLSSLVHSQAPANDRHSMHDCVMERKTYQTREARKEEWICVWFKFLTDRSPGDLARTVYWGHVGRRLGLAHFQNMPVLAGLQWHTEPREGGTVALLSPIQWRKLYSSFKASGLRLVVVIWGLDSSTEVRKENWREELTQESVFREFVSFLSQIFWLHNNLNR